MSNTGHGNRACPYLGLKDDAATSLAFPSVWNGCHRSRRIVSPNLKHQAEHCLVDDHRKCPVFLDQQADLPLPPHLRAPRSRANKTRRSPGQTFGFIHRTAALVFIGIVVLIGVGWGVLTPGLILPTAAETPSPTATALMTPAATLTATLTHTPTPTMTVTPKPTSTGEAVSKHQLDLPIGSEHQFVIHRVLYGENLNQCAARYNTSVEAIVTINYNFKTPVWEDTLVVIPVEFTDVDSLPAFEAYEVTQAGKSPEALARELGVSVEDLKYYNTIGAGESLSVGDWLLIPRPRIEL